MQCVIRCRRTQTYIVHSCAVPVEGQGGADEGHDLGPLGSRLEHVAHHLELGDLWVLCGCVRVGIESVCVYVETESECEYVDT